MWSPGDWQAYCYGKELCAKNAAGKPNDIQRPMNLASTDIKLGRQDQRDPAPTPRSISAVIYGATNTMKEPTGELEATGNVNGGARLPDLKVEGDGKKDGGMGGDAELGTYFDVPMQCVSCRVGFTQVCKGHVDTMAAAYGKLLKMDTRCRDCAAVGST
ncbi:hypothetical protein V500_01534 [Pseudogymnoascus sp. VKM F-4518 (FW-2643)]|nr:hypothetical protein V500_01534 [Pseudogymnoascus sp. VKM F-4518 (FW-2643)]